MERRIHSFSKIPACLKHARPAGPITLVGNKTHKILCQGSVASQPCALKARLRQFQ